VQLDGDRKDGAKRLGEPLRQVGPLPRIAREQQRVPHDDARDLPVSDDLGDRLHVRRRAGAHGPDRDGEPAPVIADRDADARVTEVEPQHAAPFSHAPRGAP
jgi:hypothetical protein